MTSLLVTSGGPTGIWQESWLLPGCESGGTPGAIQVVCQDLERKQGLTGGRVIISRMVTHQ